MDGKTLERAISNKELIRFYQFKRTVLFFDEWGFYLLLIALYQYSFPLWLIFPILFYGGGAIFTSYTNLNKVETQIIDVNQEIYVFKDLLVKLYQLNLEMIQRTLGIISDYINRRIHNQSIKQQTFSSPSSSSDSTNNDMNMEDIDSNHNINQ
jgi:hypothetical protein